MHTPPKPIHSGIVTTAEVEAAKPTNRTKLKKEIQRAVNTYFNEQKFNTFRVTEKPFDGFRKEFYEVAVGTAEVEFDESDPHVLRIKLKYKHEHPATWEESGAIQDGLIRSIGVQRIGPVGCHIIVGDGQIAMKPGDYFHCDFSVKCPA